jgi:hypothetical protein
MYYCSALKVGTIESIRRWRKGRCLGRKINKLPLANAQSAQHLTRSRLMGMRTLD